MLLVKMTFNEQKQHFKHFQDLKIRVLRFKGFQDVYNPCLKKKTNSHTVRAKCADKSQNF